jgi:hypothetical protein
MPRESFAALEYFVVLILIIFHLSNAQRCEKLDNYRGLRVGDLPCRIDTLKPYSIPVCFSKPDQPVFKNNPNPCGNCCGGNSVLFQPQTLGLSPGAAGAPSPCGQSSFFPSPSNTRVNKYFVDPLTGKNVTICANQLLSPLVFQPCVQYMMEFLRRHYWLVMCPQFNWFYNPLISFGETPCTQFKLLYSGIDVTVMKPDSSEPVCSTTAFIKDYTIFATSNANACQCIREENYLESERRVTYAVNVVSSCGQMRTVILSKAKDEFPPGYTCRLINNPCNPFICGQ